MNNSDLMTSFFTSKVVFINAKKWNSIYDYSISIEDFDIVSKSNSLENAIFIGILQQHSSIKNLINQFNHNLNDIVSRVFLASNIFLGVDKFQFTSIVQNVINRIKVLSDCDILIFPPWIAYPGIDQEDMFWRMGIGEDYLSSWFRYCNSRDNFSKYMELFPEISGWENVYE